MLTSIRSLMAATLLVGSAFAATPVLAQDEEAVVETESDSDFNITGNVALVTDYRFRGVSQSEGDFALQGGMDFVHDSGFYVGFWGSSIELGPVYGELELDVYAGYTTQVAEAVTIDVGILYYLYPASDDFGGLDFDTDILEPYASIATTFGPVGATFGGAYAWKQDSLGGDDNLYLYTDWTLGIPGTPVSLAAHLGYTEGPLAPPFLSGTADDDGFDWSIGATVPVYGGLTAGVSYVGTEGPSVDGFTDDAIVGTLTFTM